MCQWSERVMWRKNQTSCHGKMWSWTLSKVENGTVDSGTTLVLSNIIVVSLNWFWGGEMAFSWVPLYLSNELEVRSNVDGSSQNGTYKRKKKEWDLQKKRKEWDLPEKMEIFKNAVQSRHFFKRRFIVYVWRAKTDRKYGGFLFRLACHPNAIVWKRRLSTTITLWHWLSQTK